MNYDKYVNRYIEEKRIKEKNDIFNKISEYSGYIRQLENTTSFNEKINEKIIFYNEKINELHKTHDIIHNKMNDKKYAQEYLDNKIKSQKQQQKEKIEKKIKDKIKKEEELEKQDNFKRKRRGGGLNQKQLEREYDKYLYNVSSLPKKKQENLKEMPGNKGYIWKNIIFYGKKPPEKKKPEILYEICRGYMLIHETDENTRKIYKKEGNRNKILIDTYVK